MGTETTLTMTTSEYMNLIKAYLRRFESKHADEYEKMKRTYLYMRPIRNLFIKIESEQEMLDMLYSGLGRNCGNTAYERYCHIISWRYSHFASIYSALLGSLTYRRTTQMVNVCMSDYIELH